MYNSIRSIHNFFLTLEVFCLTIKNRESFRFPGEHLYKRWPRYMYVRLRGSRQDNYSIYTPSVKPPVTVLRVYFWVISVAVSLFIAQPHQAIVSLRGVGWPEGVLIDPCETVDSVYLGFLQQLGQLSHLRLDRFTVLNKAFAPSFHILTDRNLRLCFRRPFPSKYCRVSLFYWVN